MCVLHNPFLVYILSTVSHQNKAYRRESTAVTSVSEVIAIFLQLILFANTATFLSVTKFMYSFENTFLIEFSAWLLHKR